MAHNASLGTCISQRRKSLYERLKYEVEQDETIMRDVSLGKRIGMYKLKERIGTGSFSYVKFGVHLLSNEKVAIKVIDKLKLDDHSRRLLSNEVSCMEQLDHPNILSLFEVINTFHKMYIVTEYASGGDLQGRVNTLGPFGEDEGSILFIQLVSAIEHMHKNSVIHRDLKAENVFFVTVSHVKVGDFGFSIHSNSPTLNTFCGSPPYAAPELFLEERYCGAMVDIWALGILLYFMLTGSLPFRAQTIPLLKAQILRGEYHMPSSISPSCRDLISGILTRNPSDRLDLQTIMGCPWLYNAQGICATVNPRNEQNGTDSDILRVLEEWGVPASELKQVSLLREPRTSVDGAYRILVHRRRNNLPLDNCADNCAGSSSSGTFSELHEALSGGKRSVERQGKCPPSKYCAIF